MDEAYRIRPGLAADGPAVVDAETSCFADPWSPAGIAELFENEAVVSLVAEAHRPKTRLAGYVFARAIAGEGEILTVAVLPADRRRGVGEALVAETLRSLLARGVGSVFLEVRESNEAARRLYDRYGFKVTGFRSNYYEKPREHALVLRCDLGSSLN